MIKVFPSPQWTCAPRLRSHIFSRIIVSCLILFSFCFQEQAKNQKKKKAGKVNIKMGKADDLGLADEAGAYYEDDGDDDFI